MIHSFSSHLASTLFALAASASAVSLSGRVVTSGTMPVGVPGVTVSLTGGALTTRTDAQGAWSLGSVGVAPRVSEPARPVSGHLVVDQGRLRVSLQGRDLLGRGGTGMEARSKAAAPRAARSLAGPDTLVYSMGGKVFLKDTLTDALQTEIVRVFDTTWNPDVVHGYLKDDRDGQVYRTVRIGDRVWMAQNLNLAVDGSWCAAGNGSGGCEEFGRLYSWSAALGLANRYDTSEVGGIPRSTRGICPSGSHVPDTVEWARLALAAGGDDMAGAKLRARHSWSMLRTGNPDLTGFRALETSRQPEGSDMDRGARFWALQESGGKDAWARAIYPDFSSGGGSYRLHRSEFSKSGGISLRCVLDP